MDIRKRLLTIKILDRIKNPKYEEVVKRIGLTDVSYYREGKKK